MGFFDDIFAFDLDGDGAIDDFEKMFGDHLEYQAFCDCFEEIDDEDDFD